MNWGFDWCNGLIEQAYWGHFRPQGPAGPIGGLWPTVDPNISKRIWNIGLQGQNFIKVPKIPLQKVLNI